MSNTRIIGIDPGTRFTGYGVVDVCGSRLQHVDSGRISAPADWPLPRRLQTIHEGLVEVLTRTKPNEASLESVFVSRNVQSALKLGHARGVAMLTVAMAGIPLTEFSPGEVKRAVVGNGRAEKAQVQEMVKMLLGLSEMRSEDASDALAAAICRGQHRQLPAELQIPRSRKRGWR